MQRKPPACRRLNFDDVQSNGAIGNSEGSAGTGNENPNIQEEMRSQLETAKRRWNFDFENEVPLEGRWQWEKVLGSEPPIVETQADADAEDEASDFDSDGPEQ
jgi:hypothetical protein